MIDYCESVFNACLDGDCPPSRIKKLKEGLTYSEKVRLELRLDEYRIRKR